MVVRSIIQSKQLRASPKARDQATRHKLYKQFIEEVSKLYGDAMVNSKVEIPTLVKTYALISRMRVISSSEIVDRAEAALRIIVDVYFSPNKTIAELRVEINGGKLNLFREFNNTARQELSALKF